jgi:hypothetical protein
MLSNNKCNTCTGPGTTMLRCRIWQRRCCIGQVTGLLRIAGIAGILLSFQRLTTQGKRQVASLNNAVGGAALLIGGPIGTLQCVGLQPVLLCSCLAVADRCCCCCCYCSWHLVVCCSSVRAASGRAGTGHARATQHTTGRLMFWNCCPFR